ncbi:uncharacterized protein LOC117342782 isoform X2 [Pecten maximus]|nr:uncharacterized protein LOC117342782 isoform X2 [Pecten maximus]
MEKPPPNADILDWYVNKLYKKALDHCLQQQSSSAPTSGQGLYHRGHVQGHSNDKRQVCNSTLKCDLPKCARTIQNGGTTHQDMKILGPTSNLHGQVCRSGKDVKVSNQENLSYQNTGKGMCQKQQQLSRFQVNNILSEQGHSQNSTALVCAPEIAGTGHSHLSRQYRKETVDFYPESTERGIIPNIESNDSSYRQKGTYSQQNLWYSNSRFSEPTFSHILKRYPDPWCQRSEHPNVKKTDCHRNGRCEFRGSEYKALRPDDKDLAWFSHSVLPQQTNIQVPLPEPHDQKKPVVCSHSPESGPAARKHTKDTSVECTGLQSHERDELGIPITDPNDTEMKTTTTPGPLITALTVLEDPVNQISHNLSSLKKAEPLNSMTSVSNSSEVVPLTNGSLKLHNKALCDAAQSEAKGANSSQNQDEGEDSDSGESCKSGIIIKPGHFNQKRKRSLSLDQNRCKRRSSGTSKDKNTCPQNNKKPVKESVKRNKTKEKFSHDKNANKSFKSKKDVKHVYVSKTKVKRKKGCDSSNTKGKKKKDVIVSKTKEKKNTNKTSFEIFDVSEKKIDPRMSEHMKRCIGREISILQAHEEQAMSTVTESVGQSSDSNTMSSLAFLDLKDLAQVPELCKSKENQSVYMSKKHVGGVWKSIVKKQ